MINIDIKSGTAPDVDQQASNPRLKNAFLNKKGQIQLLPNVLKQIDLAETRAILKSTYRDRLIIATKREIYYLENNVLVEAGKINGTSFAVRMGENTQNQVTIVNGSAAWVFSQRTNGFIKLSSGANGFDLINPVDVVVLNTFTIVVSSDDDKWIVSEADNALNYDANLVVVTDNAIGKLSACAELDNNLFIFGETGVERWIPSIERLTTDFPFEQDPTYRDDFGCVSTASLVTDNNYIFYLSATGQIREMKPNGRNTISNDGIENIINAYENPENSFGSFFYHKGEYLYQLSFVAEGKNNNAFLYCPESRKWCESDDLWLGFADKAILDDGIYNVTNDYANDPTNIIIQTPYFKPKPSQMYGRSMLNSVLLEATQGKGTVDAEQVCYLQLSKDNISYGNRVKRKLSKVGDRLYQFRWYMNYSNNGFSLRFTLELQQEITITNAWALIN